MTLPLLYKNTPSQMLYTDTSSKYVFLFHLFSAFYEEKIENNLSSMPKEVGYRKDFVPFFNLSI